MKEDINLNDYITTNYLCALGFVFDATAPEGIFRMHHNKMGDHHISISFVFNKDIKMFVANYGFFHYNDKYNRIIREYQFKNGALKMNEFNGIMLDVFGSYKKVKSILKHNKCKR